MRALCIEMRYLSSIHRKIRSLSIKWAYWQSVIGLNYCLSSIRSFLCYTLPYTGGYILRPFFPVLLFIHLVVGCMEITVAFSHSLFLPVVLHLYFIPIPPPAPQLSFSSIL